MFRDGQSIFSGKGNRHYIRKVAGELQKRHLKRGRRKWVRRQSIEHVKEQTS